MVSAGTQHPRLVELERTVREQLGGVVATAKEARGLLRVSKARWSQLVSEGGIVVSRLCSGGQTMVTTLAIAEVLLRGERLSLHGHRRRG